MTDTEIETIVEKVVAKLEAKQSDFTVKELAELIVMNPEELSRLAKAGKVHGHYLKGRQHRFRKSEIIYRRGMGLNILK